MLASLVFNKNSVRKDFRPQLMYLLASLLFWLKFIIVSQISSLFHSLIQRVLEHLPVLQIPRY